ncbi:MAG: sigma-70 family RNA polymerase sigma factor [Acidobacteriota bacterium]|nr:sigma-70 family RNA polymerase sigma factor [Acidobacteriota bacterium]
MQTKTGELSGALGWRIRVTNGDPVTAGEGALDFTAADDRTLVAAFQAGHAPAFDAIVTRHQRHVYQLCYRFMHNHEDAADLAQDVFIRAHRGLKKFKGDAALTTWLYRVGVNTCLNRLALKKPLTEPLDAAPRLDARGEHPDAALMRDQDAVRVRRAIQKLPPKQRATLILRMYRELPHEEIAGILGSSVGAVKANFFHALANLRKILTTT